ncbi:MAG: hypothetical protein WCI63_03155 [bacterium]
MVRANAHASVQVTLGESVARILIQATKIPAEGGTLIMLSHRQLVGLTHCRIAKFSVCRATKTQKATADFNPT